MKKHAWIPMALALLLLLSACGDNGPDPQDAAYWRAKLAKGDPDAGEALAKMGAAALPTLTTLLQDDNETVVQNAAMALGEMKQEAAPAVPALLGALARFPENHYLAQTIEELQEAAVPALIEALKSSDLKLKEKAAKILTGVGLAAEPAFPLLIAILEGDDPAPVKMEAIAAAATISVLTVSADALPVLKRIKAGGGELAFYAANAIKRIEHKIEFEAKLAAEREAAGN